MMEETQGEGHGGSEVTRGQGEGHGGSEETSINRVLGQRAGLLELVFRLLPLRDLLVVLLVCRLWREVGEEPGLWAGLILRVTRENMAAMPQVLAIRSRHEKIQQVS